MAQEPVLTVTLNPAYDLATSIERVVPEIKLRCAAPLADPGGGGINVSRAIARIDGESRAAVSLGGPNGEAMERLLAEEGITTVPLPAPGETRLSFAVTETLTGAQFRFMMPGPEWSEADAEAAVAAVREAAPPGTRVVLSGSTPPGVPEDIAARMQAGLGSERRLYVDTSGPALHAIGRVPAGLALLRMDGAEAEDLAGRPLPTRRASAEFAADLVGRGVAEAVLVARGGDGNIVADAEGVWHAEALRVPVVSKVGAGDSFLGAFVLARARGGDLPEALGWGAAAASAACMTPATELFRREDFERLLEMREITRMA
ncbi:hexose kinase [Paracoccus sp. S-4012]|uniref:1-phosphofructokinase family hexose kinase n=1 Tax=Paracoccus sp. S-4012 TaxID=2665648 RepID=UPI001321355E|nr:hexose kinase [Paracoccus sp. S-4012]